jgi:hypothetical protein
MERRGLHKKFYSENCRGRYEKPRRRFQDNIKVVTGKEDLKVWTGFIWLRIRSSVGVL